MYYTSTSKFEYQITGTRREVVVVIGGDTHSNAQYYMTLIKSDLCC